MILKRIRLELARDEDFPDGSNKRGYDFAAPLDDGGSIDAEVWHKERDKCRVVRFWEGEENEVGHLVRKPGGSWAFHYDVHGDVNNDESGYRFGEHVFKPGNYVSIKEHDGVLRTFRVISVLDLDLT